LYVAVVFIGSYAIEALIVFAQLPLALSYALLAVPAVAAWMASRSSPSTSHRAGSLWPIPKGKALRIAFVIPVVFAAAYGIATQVGYVHFDWGFNELMGLLSPIIEGRQIDPALEPFMPAIFFVMGLVLSIVLGPTAYAAVMLGNEYGWRGYLLPRLMPLGRWPAYIITGLLWGLSILPIVLLTPGSAPLQDSVRILAMMTALSILLGEVWNRSRHLGLVAICCGCCICQATTIWTFVVISSTTLLPFESGFDNVSIVAFLVLAFGMTFVFGKLDVSAKEVTGAVSGQENLDG
jgi:hypothetical protein